MAVLSLGSYYGIDSLIDLLIVVVSIVVFLQSRKIYLLSKQRTFNFFSISFLMIGISFFFKILANLTKLYEVTFAHPSLIISIFSSLGNIEIIHLISFLLFKVFFVCGFLALLLIFSKSKNASETVVFFYLGLVTVIFSIFYNFIFHLTLVIVISAICIYFYVRFIKTRSRLTLYLFIAFLFIFASNFASIFTHLDLIIYIASEVIMFVGFVIILFVHLKIKNGKEKIKIRSN